MSKIEFYNTAHGYASPDMGVCVSMWIGKTFVGYVYAFPSSGSWMMGEEERETIEKHGITIKQMDDALKTARESAYFENEFKAHFNESNRMFS